VLVVDANRDGPSISCRLGLPEVPGLREVLAGSVTLESALQATGQEHLQALTAGNLQRGPAVRWHGEPLRALLQQLRSRFDLILIDAPCWEDRPEAALLATLADAVYVVSCEAETDQSARLLEAIARHGAPLRGQIFTGA
jgi:receptor protein-tyrosine kinase